MQIGSCWTKTEEKEDGKKSVTGISVSLDEAILEVYPQLKHQIIAQEITSIADAIVYNERHMPAK